ncbi:MAG TPA: SPOR domain-containing protein [Gemmatimonadales bacterium]|nr:SPOR domain-containing protein [Gemmatimonadales bacterium]
MTGRPLPRSRLDALVPSLVTGQALIALVPATGDLKWAAGAAWDVARAAAVNDRRVALVDLWLEHPMLHETVGLSPTEGIVDAFEYDVSLTKAAHEIDHVFFIAAGAATAHAGDLFANPRWKKLHGGFQVEGALLVLFLSAGALARLSTVPDGLIVLSPDGYEPESSIGQGIAAVMERGVPLLGVVRERWTPGPMAVPAPDARSVAPPPGRISASVARRPTRRRAARPVVVAATLVAGAAGGWGLLARGAEHGPPSTPARTAPAHMPRARPVVAAPALRPDSLAWTVQLAAYAGLDKALALADRLSAEGITPFVTPVALEARAGSGGAGSVWYRVFAGAYPTRDSALSARSVLWTRRLADRGQGDVLRAPYSLALSQPGRTSRDSLRAHGIAAVSWDAGRLLAGAFETPEQAAVLERQLKRAGVSATLVTRMTTTP